MLKPNVTAGANAAPQQSELPLFHVRCGQFFVGATEHTRVGDVEGAGRFAHREATAMLSRLQRPNAGYPLPWAVVPVAGGAR